MVPSSWAGLVLGRKFLQAGRFLGLLGIEALLEFIQLAAQLLGPFLLGLLVTYLLDRAFDLGIAATQDFLCLGTGIMNDLTVLGTDVVQTLVIVTDELVQAFFLGTHVLTLVFPIAAITHDVKQVLVHVDIVTAHNLAGLINHLLGQTRLAGNLDGK